MGSKPQFTYETYERNIFATREELTGLSKIIMDTKVGWFGVVVNTLRCLALLALFRIRQAMYSEEMEIGKQIYERRRSGSNRDDVENGGMPDGT